MGRAGESIGAWWLRRSGAQILRRNLETKDGELDIVAVIDGRRVAVEVRTRVGQADPIDAIDPAKRDHVRYLARRARCDAAFLGIGVQHDHLDIHWVPDW